MTRFLIRLFVRDSDQVEAPEVRRKYGTLSGVVGICCNAVLFALKLLAGLAAGSISVVADALNNLSDAGSSVVTLVGFRMAGRPSDDEHPFGHGRIEYISGLIVSLIIMLMGVELFQSSVDKILHPEELSFRWITIGVLGFSVLLKLWMAAFHREVGRRLSSSAMKAAAADSFSDVAATAAVAAGMLIFHFFQLNIDGWIGIVVACFILYTGFGTVRDTMNDLLGQAPDAEFVSAIEKKVLSYPEVTGIHDLIVHSYGPGRRIISLHAEVPSDADFQHIHAVIDEIERDLKQSFQCEAVIHMDPTVTDDKRINHLQEQIRGLVTLIDPRLTIHDFRLVDAEKRTTLLFDVVVPHRFRMTDEEVSDAVKRAVQVLDESYDAVITIDKSYTV